MDQKSVEMLHAHLPIGWIREKTVHMKPSLVKEELEKSLVLSTVGMIAALLADTSVYMVTRSTEYSGTQLFYNSGVLTSPGQCLIQCQSKTVLLPLITLIAPSY